jgi:hypothetical protein
MYGPKDQHKEDSDNDLHAREDPNPAPDSILCTNERRFDDGRGMGQLESAVSLV